MDESHIKILEKNISKPTLRITEVTDEQIGDSNILIINTVGMLSSLYQYGDMAYIGGAFRDGVHNILEAVAFGLPVIFGDKNLNKFPETLELMKLGGAFSISNKAQAEDTLVKLLTNEKHLKNTSNICRAYVSERAGATEIIMNHINKR